MDNFSQDGQTRPDSLVCTISCMLIVAATMLLQHPVSLADECYHHTQSFADWGPASHCKAHVI